MSSRHKTIPLTSLRKMIAARMQEAKQTIPHFRVGVDIEMDALIACRKGLRAARPHIRLSLNDLLIKACAVALMKEPGVNVQWAENEIHQYANADISVIMAVEGGVSAPIVRCAESKSVWEIAQEVRELATRAAKNTLKVAEILGGSFSLSNLGMYGVDRFDAIINPPQCAILAVATAQPRVIALTDGMMRVATIMTATLSCDHRAIDGATGARFLAALRQQLEHPETLL